MELFKRLLAARALTSSERHPILLATPPEVPTTHQLMLAMAASLGYLSIGMVRGFSSPGVPSMQDISPHLVPDEEAVSWVSAIPPVGASIGSLCSGPLLQLFGRKKTLMLSCPFFIVAWVLVATSQVYGMLLGGRFLSGFCVGFVLTSAQVYVSECAHQEVRGMLGSIPTLFMSGGILLAYILGAFLPWTLLAAAAACFPALMLLLLTPLPESPVWLHSHGRYDEARQALKWLHRSAPGVEMSEMKTKDNTAQKPSSVATVSNILTTGEPLVEQTDQEPIPKFWSKAVLKPFGLSVAMMGFQQLSGIDAIVFYTVRIFESAGSALNENIATILVGLVQLVANILALPVVDRAGRRPLLMVSGGLTSISMAALGTHFYLQSKGEAAQLGMLPLISLLVFMLGFSLGLCTLPYLLMAELLPTAYRSPLSAAAGSFNLAVMFGVIKTYPTFVGIMGEYGTFWMYSALCAASGIFVWVLLPETKGRTFEDIEKSFQKKNTKKTESKSETNSSP